MKISRKSCKKCIDITKILLYRKPRPGPQLGLFKIIGRAKSPLRLTCRPGLAQSILGLAWPGSQLQARAGTSLTFIDSGASDMMFVSKEAFETYKAIPLCSGDSVKVVNGSVAKV